MFQRLAQMLLTSVLLLSFSETAIALDQAQGCLSISDMARRQECYRSVLGDDGVEKSKDDIANAEQSIRARNGAELRARQDEWFKVDKLCFPNICTGATAEELKPIDFEKGRPAQSINRDIAKKAPTLTEDDLLILSRKSPIGGLLLDDASISVISRMEKICAPLPFFGTFKTPSGSTTRVDLIVWQSQSITRSAVIRMVRQWPAISDKNDLASLRSGVEQLNKFSFNSTPSDSKDVWNLLGPEFLGQTFVYRSSGAMAGLRLAVDGKLLIGMVKPGVQFDIDAMREDCGRPSLRLD